MPMEDCFVCCEGSMIPKPRHVLLAGFLGALALLAGVEWFGWRHSVRLLEMAEAAARTRPSQALLDQRAADARHETRTALWLTVSGTAGGFALLTAVFVLLLR